MKVLKVSRNVLNLSTSPSGRLDALVPPTETQQQDTPRLLLNDRTINVSGISLLTNCIIELNKNNNFVSFFTGLTAVRTRF